MDLSYFDDAETGERKQRPNTKSLADVERVINKHKGKNDAAINLFVAMYLDGVQWDWLSAYQEWEVNYQSIEAENAARDGEVVGTAYEWEGTEDDAVKVAVDVLYTPKPLPDEPPRPPLVTVEQWKVNNYALLRAAAFPTIEDQLAMQYDDSVNGTTGWVDMQDAVKAKYPKEL